MGIHHAIGVMLLDPEGAGDAIWSALLEERADLAAKAPVPWQELVAFRKIECLGAV